MWRTFFSLALTFGAIGWAVFSATLCFFYGASFWIDHTGRFGAFYAALVSFAVCFFGARLLLRLADKLVEPYSGPFDAGAYEAAPPDTFYRDWQRYAQDVIVNRRYAFYARTRQWEKLRMLEAVAASEVAARPAVALPEPPHPALTSMAARLTDDENRRGARRTSFRPRRVERWAALDEGEVLPS